MNGVANIWNAMFSWMPPALAVFFGAFVVFTVLILAFKLVAFVLDILPFA